MKIGFASPVSIRLLADLVAEGETLPLGYEFGPAATWVRELIARGHEVTIYTTARDVAGPVSFSGDRLRIRIAKGRSWGAARDFFAVERKQLTEMMWQDRCEILHAHWTYEFAQAALATGIPTLVTIHDLPWNVLRFFRDKHRAARLLMAYRVASKGRFFTAVSDDAARHFRRYLNPIAQITVVPNSLSDAIFHLHEQFAPPMTRNAVTFGTILQGWTRRKNAEAALGACRIMRGTLPEARMMMIGTDYQEDGPAHQWAVKMGLTEGVVFRGPLPYDTMLRTFSDEIDVLVHPSLDESFSMVALEGMALKKPVIAGKNTPGVRSVLDYGNAGSLVDVRKPEEIAAEMVRLGSDSGLREQMAQKAYDSAYSRFRVQNVIAQYEAAYARVLQSS